MLWSSSSQTNTFWHKWKPHVTITLMIIHFFTWALWLGYRRMNVILERKQSPGAHQKYIGDRLFINPENLWQIKRKYTLTLLWPQWPFFVYLLSQHIPPGNISFKGNAAELVDNYAPEQLLLLQVPQDTHNQCSSHPSHTLAWNTSSVHSS